MDDFKLEDMETVFSEYDIADCGSFVSESVVMSSMNSLYDSTTDESAFWKNDCKPFIITIIFLAKINSSLPDRWTFQQALKYNLTDKSWRCIGTRNKHIPVAQLIERA